MRKHQTPIPFSVHAHPNEARASVEDKQKVGYLLLVLLRLGGGRRLGRYRVRKRGVVQTNLAVLLLAVHNRRVCFLSVSDGSG